jgi:hypothetical protein
MAAGVGIASAATVQNSRGTFIQDRHGTWHQYVRLSQRRALTNVYASADYGTWHYRSGPQVRGVYYASDDYRPERQYYQSPQFRSSIGFDGQYEYDYRAYGQLVMEPQGRYPGAFYANEGTYPVAYIGGGPSHPSFGIISEH